MNIRMNKEYEMTKEYENKLYNSAIGVYQNIREFAKTFEIPESEALEVFKIAVLADIKTELLGVQDSIDALF